MQRNNLSVVFPLMRNAVIQVDNDKSQNPNMVLRQFSKKVIGSGLLRKARANRYYVRPKTELSKKTSALKRLEKKAHIEKLLKLGKAVPNKRGRRR